MRAGLAACQTVVAGREQCAADSQQRVWSCPPHCFGEPQVMPGTSGTGWLGGCWLPLSQQRSLNAHKLAPWCSCRKKKAVHKTTSTDDKRLQNTLKRLGVNTIPGIEEVNIFQGDDVINFTNPKGAACRPQSIYRASCGPSMLRYSSCMLRHCRSSSSPSSDGAAACPCSASVHRRQHICDQRPLADQECAASPSVHAICSCPSAAFRSD
jgi:NAC domain